MAGPKTLVPPPTFDPRNFGLLSVVQPRYDEPDEHWRNGVIWQDICGLGGSTYDPFCLPTGTATTPAEKSDNIDWNTYAATPLTVFAELDCSAVGFTQEEMRVRGATALTQTETYQLERAFWTGQASGDSNIIYPHLAANAVVNDTTLLPVPQLQCAATTVTGSVILDVAEGLGRLEAAFSALYQGKGVIHVPTALTESIFTQHIAQISGTQLRTGLGNLIAVGAGYPGTGPDGTSLPNAVWVYMTPPIFAYRSAQFSYRFVQMFDRSANTYKMIVERTYVLGYSCCALVALPISLGGDVTGQPLSAF